MQRTYHRAITTIIFLVAITVFTINVVNLMLIQGLIVFLTFLVGINIYGIATQSTTFKSISIMIAISLLFIGVAVFGHFGPRPDSDSNDGRPPVPRSARGPYLRGHQRPLQSGYFGTNSRDT